MYVQSASPIEAEPILRKIKISRHRIGFSTSRPFWPEFPDHRNGSWIMGRESLLAWRWVRLFSRAQPANRLAVRLLRRSSSKNH